MSVAGAPSTPPALSRRTTPPVIGRAADRLRVVPQATARASSGAFALFVAALLAGGLLGLLALNTLISQGSFASDDLTRRQALLADQEEQLSQQVAELESPRSLALAATRLGMVGTVNPVFIDPRTGRVLGVPVPGRAAPAPAPSPSASASPSTQPSTQPSTGATTKPSAGATTKPSTGATTKPTTRPTTRASAGPSPSPTAHR